MFGLLSKQNKLVMRKLYYYLMAFSLLFAGTAAIAQVEQNENEMMEMSLEDLMGIEITSVSKKAERLQDVASAIYVITKDDINKSGATTIHELLRNVPGYWGVQDEYNRVETGMRYSAPQNGKVGSVLYLLDGTPLLELMGSNFAFHNFDIPLDELERIEIIKGSGGAIYGANSATGVVNIFTKDSDKYDGINVRVEGAAPGYASGSVRAGGKISEKFSLSGYGKVRYFKGYGLLPEFDGAQVNVPLNDGSGSTSITNAYTEDFEKSMMISLGAKAKLALTENTSISLRAHYNTLDKGQYTTYIDASGFRPPPMLLVDTKTYKETNPNRFTGSMRFDHSFGENNSLFIRISSNSENDFVKVSGGYEISNNILDFEVQDNFTLGINDFSVGVNYRAVNFDIHSITSEEMINYINPQSNESITGAFIQDKLRVVPEKLDLLLGVKAENYSLVNDKYYFSPMGKLSYRPNANITLWGGYTQSYTTPGFNQTNVDLILFSSPFPTVLPNIGVVSGSETTPTKFGTSELGIRFSANNKISIESNFFFTQYEDGISPSINPTFTGISPTRPGIPVQYYVYGNYVKGTSIGTETVIKFFPVSGLNIEVSHNWLDTKGEYQENNDFDINDPTVVPPEQLDLTLETPFIPHHIFRFRGSYDISSTFSISSSVVFASEFNTQADYNYELQRYVSLLGSQFGESGTTVSKNSSRFIFNLRVEKKVLNEALSIYAFGNDVFNQGIIAQTNNLNNATLSQVGAMYGLGFNYKF